MFDVKRDEESSLKVLGCFCGGALGFLLGPLLCMLVLESWFHMRGYSFHPDIYLLVIGCMPAGAALGALLLPTLLVRRARKKKRRARP